MRRQRNRRTLNDLEVQEVGCGLNEEDIECWKINGFSAQLFIKYLPFEELGFVFFMFWASCLGL